jgi:hypothetical protein
MKYVPKFKLCFSLSWQTPCTSCSWQLVTVSGFLALCLSWGLNKINLNLAMMTYCHDSSHWLADHVNTLRQCNKC